MGFFSSIGKALGRAVGRAVEKAGEVIGSQTVSRWGRNIQDACSETSKRTGQQKEYDSSTASDYQTQQMADILASFSLGLKSQAQTIEVAAKQTVERYFDNLTAAISGAVGDNTMVRSLMLQKSIVTGNIDGKLRDVLAKRVSLTDSECSKILKMPAGYNKENAMNQFGRKVIQEGLDALADSVSKSLDTVCDMISKELDETAQQQKMEFENFAIQLQEVLKHQGDSTSDKESCMLNPAERLSASEIVMELLEGN